LQEDARLVAEPDQKQNVHKEPGEPGEPAAQLQLSDLSNGTASTDGGENSLVFIVESISAGLALRQAAEQLANIGSLLSSYGRQSWQELTGCVKRCRRVADYERFLAAKNCQLGIYRDPAGAVTLNLQPFRGG